MIGESFLIQYFFYQDWEILAFLQALKGIVRASNSVAVITFPASLLKPSMAVRWQHFADILLSVEAVLGEQPSFVLINENTSYRTSDTCNRYILLMDSI